MKDINNAYNESLNAQSTEKYHIKDYKKYLKTLLQIGRFNGKSKGAWWEAFLKADTGVIKALQALGDDGSTLSTLVEKY